MADEAKEPEVKEELTPEQEADRHLDEIFAEVNAEEPEPEVHDEDDETIEQTADRIAEEKAKAAAVEKPAEVVAEKKPATLVRTARSLGITDAKIASLSPDALDSLCDTLLEQRDAEAAKLAEKKEEPEAVEDEDEKLLKELTEEEFDPRIIKMLSKTVAAKKELEAERKALQQSEQQKRVQQMVNEVDTAFAELDSPLLGGNAKVFTMDQATEEMERRNLIVRMAYEKPIEGKSLGENVKVYAKKILGIAASEKPAPTSALEEKKKRWQAAGTATPRSRVEKEEPGDDAAIKAVGKWMKEVGFNDED